MGLSSKSSPAVGGKNGGDDVMLDYMQTKYRRQLAERKRLTPEQRRKQFDRPTATDIRRRSTGGAAANTSGGSAGGGGGGGGARRERPGSAGPTGVRLAFSRSAAAHVARVSYRDRGRQPGPGDHTQEVRGRETHPASLR